MPSQNADQKKSAKPLSKRLEAFVEPTQERSKRTYNKLLDALEDLLEQRTIHDVSVSEIADKAGVTTGAIYRRFRDKRGLLQAAASRFYHEAPTARGIDTADPNSDTEVLRLAFHDGIRYAIKHMPLLRAATAYEDEFTFDLLNRARDELVESMINHLKTSRYEGDELQRRCKFVLWISSALAREKFRGGHVSQLSEEQFEKEYGAAVDGLTENLIEIAMGYLSLD